MAKNKRRQQENNAAKVGEIKSPARPWLSQRGKKFMAAGVALVVLGFWILTYTDPAGQNWASTLSPALLVLGYTIIGFAIVIQDSTRSSSSPNLPRN